MREWAREHVSPLVSAHQLCAVIVTQQIWNIVIRAGASVGSLKPLSVAPCSGTRLPVCSLLQRRQLFRNQPRLRMPVRAGLERPLLHRW